MASSSSSSRAGWLLALLPLAVVVYLAAQLPTVLGGETIAASVAWVPRLGIALSFQLDGLSLLFGLLIAGIGVLVVVYAGGYLGGHPQLARFYATLMLFMVAMLGVVCAGDLITLFIFWELTSITSYLLIGFDHERAAARAAALQALLVTGGGGLALLAGALLLGQVAGGYEFWRLTQAAAAIHASPLYGSILILVLLAAFTKSAQVPFHFWLPAAMEAPTPVSAYLDSATLVKAGVFLVARLTPVLGGSDAWATALIGAGGATMLTGALLAWPQRDLKRLLAYSTVSALGTLMLLLGLGTPLAVSAAMVFLLAHSLYKGALFMVAGAVDHATGTRDVTRLGGLAAALPLLAAAALTAGLSMAGVAPELGFVAKELLYETALAPPAGWIGAPVILTVAVIASALTVAVAGRVVLRPFFVRATALPAVHAPDLALLLGPVLLALLGLGLGLAPQRLVGGLVAAAASAVRDAPTAVPLALWHGLSPALGLSLLTLLAGAGLYVLAGSRALARAAAALAPLAALTPTRAYDAALVGLKALATGQTRVLQNGSLSLYLLVVFAALCGAVAWTLTGDVGWTSGWQLSPVGLPEVAVCAVMIVAAGAILSMPSRLGAIAALGVVGYGIALLFVFFGAPDLALTQFAIETLTVILFVLVIYRLPRFARFSTPATRLRDGAVAVAVGTLMGALVLVATASPLRSPLARFFADQSLLAANGRNVVNVILVDFRALDTLGEITVLAAAAIGIFALRRLRLQRDTATPLAGDAAARGATPLPPPHPLLLAIATRHLFPLMLLFSLFVLLRGHNAPGGGFVGGLMAAAAFALYLLAFGTAAARTLLRLAPQVVIGLGLLLAGVSGLPALADGLPYMTAIWGSAPLPVLGKFGTPLVFDVGVYLVVLGVVLLMVFTLAED